MVKDIIIINRYYRTPEGVCHVVGFSNILGVHIYEYLFYKDISRHTILKELALKYWAPFDGDDYPNQEDPRLPPSFDLLFDIKRESQLQGYHKYLKSNLRIVVKRLKDFNELCRDYKLLGR